MKEYAKEMTSVIAAGLKACDAVMKVYRSDFDVYTKEDKSPVTEADFNSNRIIRSMLSEYKDIAWLSEEDKDDLTRLKKKKLWVIDPLDGTSDFVNHNNQFAINIALVVKNIPVLGAIFNPMERSYCYAIINQGCKFVDRSGKATRCKVSKKTSELTIVETISHMSDKEAEFFKKNKASIKEIKRISASLKAIEIARGFAEFCIRYSTDTKEWDVCASDIIVREAGGIFLDPNLKPFTYNRENVYNPYGYLMSNCEENLKLLDTN